MGGQGDGGERKGSNGKPTIDDVATLAGVSRTSVSRVLNNGPNVRAALRDKVQAAVDALGFTVNIQARNLAGRTSGQIALVHQSDLDTEPNSFYHAALELGALRSCSRRGFQLVTRTVSGDRRSVRDQIAAMIDGDWIAGLMLTPPLSDDAPLIAMIRKRGTPVVGISGAANAEGDCPTIGIDDYRAGFDLGTYIAGLGHRRLGYIHGLADHLSARRRFEGLLDAIGSLSIVISLVEEQGTFTFHSGIECAQRLLALDERPTALICANDDMAAGALLALHRAGLSIPGDMAVAGFDDTPISEIVWPPLTTIHQPIKTIGQEAADILINQIQRESAPEGEWTHRVIEHYLVTRDSTAPLGA